jgi:N-methylhydantoinase A
VLVAYGGAGPTHAAFYGAEIASKAILVLADSTAFSAEGMLTCDVTHTAQASSLVSTPFSDGDLARVGERFAGLEARVLEQFAREGAAREEVALSRSVGVRYRWQVHTLDVEVDGEIDGGLIAERFERRYGLLFGEGALLAGGGLELERHSVVGTRAIDPIAFRAHEPASDEPSPTGAREAWFDGGFVSTPLYDGHRLRTGHRLAGPAIVERMGDSVVVPPGYTATVDEHLTIRLAA